MHTNNSKYKVIINLGTYALLFSVLILAGCATQQKDTTKQIPVPDISVTGIDKAEAMETVEDILAQMHFVIDKSDAEAGYIRTRPLEGAQFFEFWRSDNVGTENWLYSNLHSVRRTVEVNIDQQIHCKVQIQRLSLPEQPVTSSARAYGMFSLSTPIIQTLRLNPEQAREMAWIDLGKDSELEKEIIKRIDNRLNSVN